MKPSSKSTTFKKGRDGPSNLALVEKSDKFGSEDFSQRK